MSNKLFKFIYSKEIKNGKILDLFIFFTVIGTNLFLRGAIHSSMPILAIVLCYRRFAYLLWNHPNERILFCITAKNTWKQYIFINKLALFFEFNLILIPSIILFASYSDYLFFLKSNIYWLFFMALSDIYFLTRTRFKDFFQRLAINIAAIFVILIFSISFSLVDFFTGEESTIILIFLLLIPTNIFTLLHLLKNINLKKLLLQ